MNKQIKKIGGESELDQVDDGLGLMMPIPTRKVYREGNVVYFLDEMDRESIHILEKHLNEMVSDRFIQDVHIVIDSFGGNTCGIYDILKVYPLPITTWVRGYCCSAATILFLAGSKRYISATSMFLIHSLRAYVSQEMKEGDAIDFHESFVKDNEVSLLRVYKKETKIPKAVLAQLPHKETWLTPEQCVEYKIANDIKTFSRFTLI